MILLLGGTSETAEAATTLAERGFQVLVSTATDAPLDCGTHENISRRIGPLNEGSMAALIREKGIVAIVDAAHPYAGEVHGVAARVAVDLGLPLFRFRRPPGIQADGQSIFARTHEEAAEIAASFGKPILLTTGSRNLAPYVRAATEKGVVPAARVLDRPESVEAARGAGIPEERIIVGRGPFSLEENLEVIRKWGIGVLVTKDGGEAGGVQAKPEAARIAGCALVVVQRPEEDQAGPSFSDVPSLVQAVCASVGVLDERH